MKLNLKLLMAQITARVAVAILYEIAETKCAACREPIGLGVDFDMRDGAPVHVGCT